MSWGLVAMGTAAAVSVGSKAYSYNQAKNAKSNLEGFELASYEEDPDYLESQEALKKLGIGLLDGNVPDFYSDIGKQGSDAFLQYLDLSNSKISDSVLESAAATGRRGGAVQSQIAESVGENTTALSYQDYLTALQGKESLLKIGATVTEGVRGAGQQKENMVNNFNQKNSVIDLDYRVKKDDIDMKLGAIEAEALAGLVDAGIGGLTGFAGAGGVSGAGGLKGGLTGGFEGILGAGGYTNLLNTQKDTTIVGGEGNRKIHKGAIAGSNSGAWDSILQLLNSK